MNAELYDALLLEVVMTMLNAELCANQLPDDKERTAAESVANHGQLATRLI